MTNGKICFSFSCLLLLLLPPLIMVSFALPDNRNVRSNANGN
jgi:hypothetical protein